MLDILKEKILTWTHHDASLFHNHLIRDKTEGDYIWEHTDDGIFLTREGSSHFIGFNGYIYKLTDLFANCDFEMHKKLLDSCEKVNIRLDIPLEHKFVEIGVHPNTRKTKLSYTISFTLTH